MVQIKDKENFLGCKPAGNLLAMMKRDDLLDLNEAVQHPGLTLSFDITTELPQEGDLDLRDSVEGFLDAVSTGNLLLIKGEFKTKAAVECARCTSPLEIEVSFEVDEQFPVVGIPAAYSPKESAKVAAEEDYPLFEGNSLMVDDLLRQAVLLALPMQPLCQYGWDQPCPIAESLGLKNAEPANGSAFGNLGAIVHDRLSNKRQTPSQ